MLPQQTNYHGNWISYLQKISLFVENFLENQFWQFICLNFTFSTIFIVNNGHRAIKVHVNRVQYCRAGHILKHKQLKFLNLYHQRPERQCIYLL